LADNRTAEVVSAVIRDAEKNFDLDLSAASDVVTTRNQTVVSEILRQSVRESQNFINNWVADWFGFSDADKNNGTDRKGRRDDEDW